METGLAGLIPPTALPHAAKAASMLADALEKGESVAVVGDYDCDGATASTVAYKGLRLLGFRPEKVSWFIPDRMSMGYGLSPVVVDALTENTAALTSFSPWITAWEAWKAWRAQTSSVSA